MALKHAQARQIPSSDATEQDYFVQRDGVRYAGTHLLVELWGAQYLDDPVRIERALRQATEAAKATLLAVKLHHFGNGGVSGVALLAESHISIHTWPEAHYAAIDIFMCGTCNPYDAAAVLRERLVPQRVQMCEHKRGMLP